MKTAVTKIPEKYKGCGGDDNDDDIDCEEKLSPPRCYIVMKMVTVMLVIMIHDLIVDHRMTI